MLMSPGRPRLFDSELPIARLLLFFLSFFLDDRLEKWLSRSFSSRGATWIGNLLLPFDKIESLESARLLPLAEPYRDRAEFLLAT